MLSRRYCCGLLLVVFLLCIATVCSVFAQGAKLPVPGNSIADRDGDHVKKRNEWFYRGRVLRGKGSAELRRRAYQAKLQMRALRAAAIVEANGVSGRISL